MFFQSIKCERVNVTSESSGVGSEYFVSRRSRINKMNRLDAQGARRDKGSKNLTVISLRMRNRTSSGVWEDGAGAPPPTRFHNADYCGR